MLTRGAPMKRSPFKAKTPAPKPAKQVDYTPRPRPVAQAVAELPPSKPVLKTGERRDQRIRDSANGEECQVRLIGTCNGRTDTTVWSHFPGLDADRGMGMKALDLCGAYACFACHDAVDGRTHNTPGHDRTAILLAWMYGHMRSLVILKQKGLV